MATESDLNGSSHLLVPMLAKRSTSETNLRYGVKQKSFLDSQKFGRSGNNRRISEGLVESGLLMIDNDGGKKGRDNQRMRDIILNPTNKLEEIEDSLHVLAFGNCDKKICNYVRQASNPDIMEKFLESDPGGNLPAMVAALNNKKEALHQLLVPFMTSPEKETLDRLIHHYNSDDQNLLCLVVHHRRLLSVAHGMLIEFECIVHDWDSKEIKACLRKSLGSTSGAIDSLYLFDRIYKKEGSDLHLTRFATCCKVFFLTFFARIIFMLSDLYLDVHLLKDYFIQWTNDTSVSSEFFSSSSYTSIGSGDLSNSSSIDSDFLYVHPSTRFCTTLTLLFLPIVLNLFELLRFRLFSSWIDENIPTEMETNRVLKKLKPALILSAKCVVNVFLLTVWMFVVLFRNFWYRFRFECSETKNKVSKHREYMLALTIAIRAQLIKACTEASLQPIFQLYLIFSQFQTSQIQKMIWNPEDYQKRQMVSVALSILGLAASFTVHYRENKENSLGPIATLVYFMYTVMAVIGRTLCFQIFAFAIGPNWHYLIISIAAHVVMMSLLHFVFSDSLNQWYFWISGNSSSVNRVRQFLLVIHNCFVNGLANLYVHNNIEMFLHVADVKPHVSSKIDRENSEPTTFYGPIDVQQRTFIRQVFVDVIIMIENVAMVLLASTTDKEELYNLSVRVIITSYSIAIILKMVFYFCCHPWSELIRPKFMVGTDCNNAYMTSCVVLGKHINFGVDKKLKFTIEKDQDQDLKRCKPILPLSESIVLPNIETNGP